MSQAPSKPATRFFVYLGLVFIISSIAWFIYALAFGGTFSMVIFTNLVVGLIFLLIGLVKPRQSTSAIDIENENQSR